MALGLCFGALDVVVVCGRGQAVRLVVLMGRERSRVSRYNEANEEMAATRLHYSS